MTTLDALRPRLRRLKLSGMLDAMRRQPALQQRVLR